MQEQALRNSGPLRFGELSLQIQFDSLGIVRGGQAQSIGDSFDMRVDDNGRLPEGGPQDHVRGLAADSWNGRQLFHALRNGPAESFRDGFAASDQVLGFILIESGRFDQGFQFEWRGGCKVLRTTKSFEQCRRDLIDPLVGALGGKDRGDEQFPRRLVGQFHLGFRLVFQQQARECGGLCCHG